MVVSRLRTVETVELIPFRQVWIHLAYQQMDKE
jgi:hypothetical protein